MTRLIYNTDDLLDVVNVLQYINNYTEALGVKEVLIDANKIHGIIKGIKSDFPHVDGVDEASTFKKVAHFVCYFVSERPIAEPFPVAIVGEKLAKIDNHQNSMVALALAIDSLENSTVLKKRKEDGQLENYEIKNRIVLSSHSYKDIVDALASATPSASFKLVTVLFEQLVYKTNSDCQYSELS